MNLPLAAQNTARKYWLRMIIAIAFLVPLNFSTPAFAALGGDRNSIQNDSVQMKGTVRVAQESDTYSVHEITLPGKTLVREYISSEGKIFAVAWNGPFLPDMHQLLGDYFPKYSEAVKNEKAKYVGRRPLNIQRSDLVAQTGGHMRSYFGRVFVPDLVPQNFSQEQIK